MMNIDEARSFVERLLQGFGDVDLRITTTYPENLAIWVSATGVIILDDYLAILNAIERATFHCCPYKIIFRLHGMIKGPMIVEQAIAERFAHAGIVLDDCTIDHPSKCVRLVATPSDSPEMYAEQSRAVQQVMQYVAPFQLFINGQMCPVSQ